MLRDQLFHTLWAKCTLNLQHIMVEGLFRIAVLLGKASDHGAGCPLQDPGGRLSLVLRYDKWWHCLAGWSGGPGEAGEGTERLPGLSHMSRTPMRWTSMISFPKEHNPLLLSNCLLAHTFPWRGNESDCTISKGGNGGREKWHVLGKIMPFWGGACLLYTIIIFRV